MNYKNTAFIGLVVLSNSPPHTPYELQGYTYTFGPKGNPFLARAAWKVMMMIDHNTNDLTNLLLYYYILAFSKCPAIFYFSLF